MRRSEKRKAAIQNRLMSLERKNKTHEGILCISLVRMNASDPQLLVVALRILERGQSSEKTIGLMIRACGEIETCCESGCSIVAE